MGGDPKRSSFRARQRNHSGTKLEDVIRPIVEGQLRSFGQSHPTVVEAVDWDGGHPTKLDAFVASGSKRITNALLADHAVSQMRSAFAGK